MTAKVIAVLNQKGGCGKTNTTMELAGSLGKSDLEVLVVDADPQGTSQRWSVTAPDDTPFPAHVVGFSHAGGKVHKEVKKYYDKYDYIIVDCPPSVDSPVPASILMVADLAIVPVIPSPPDLWAAVEIVELIENIRDVYNEELIGRILINLKKPNRNLAADVLSVVEKLNISVMQTVIHDRDAYKAAAGYGVTVHDLGSSAKKAQEEIAAFAQEVYDILEPSLAAETAV